jgi:hypothetical protein
LKARSSLRKVPPLDEAMKEIPMRVVNLILGVLSVGTLAAMSAAGCGGGSANGGSGTTSSSGATTGSSSGMMTYPCSPPKTCTAADKSCVGLVDNTGQTKFGLRMSELDITAPMVLAQPPISPLISGAVAPNNTACNESGNATFSWLLQFDTSAGTLKTGGARYVADPTMGYAFDMEMLAGKAIAPVTLMTKPDASGNFSVTMGQTLNVPIFLDTMGKSYVVLPLQQARIVMGTLSANHNCIGTFNAKNLDPTSSCSPDATHPLFLTGGKLDGYITLEDADQVPVSALSETLCVLLSPDPTMYGVPGTGAQMGTTVCKRDAMNKIAYQGSWCSTTNAAATASCGDAEQLAANFAASSVKITN